MPLLKAIDRIRALQLEADAAFDVSINNEAQKVFQAWMKHVQQANLNHAFFEDDKSVDEDYGISYYNTYPGHYSHTKFKNVHMLMSKARDFSDVDHVRDLTIILMVHDDIGQTLGGQYFGFKTNQSRKVITLYLYCPHEHDEPSDVFPLEEFDEEFVAANPNVRDMKSSFVHEYRHLIDDLTARKKNSGNVAMRKFSPTSNYAAYINDVEEINARYAQWITAVTGSLRAAKAKFGSVAKAYPRFEPFWKAYWTNQYAPAELRIHITAENKRRLARRFYKFWDWAKSQTDLTPIKAVKFAKKQTQDDEIYVPREF